jgi:putative hydrolase of the HAD superfamily
LFVNVHGAQQRVAAIVDVRAARHTRGPLLFMYDEWATRGTGSRRLLIVCHNLTMARVDRRHGGAAKLVLFDLDNTLFDRASAYREWAHQYVADMGLGQAEVEWFCEIDQDGFADRRTVWSAAKDKFGLSQSVGELVASYRSDYLDFCRPDETVLVALTSLRESGWRIGIVTNGPIPQQADKAERLGLLPMVDAFCASGELGVEKPDRRIFAEAISRCTGGDPNIDPTWWMVGDAPIPDIFGGRAAGLRTMWLDRGRRWNPSDGEAPDSTVSSPVDAVHEIMSQKA